MMINPQRDLGVTDPTNLVFDALLIVRGSCSTAAVYHPLLPQHLRSMGEARAYIRWLKWYDIPPVARHIFIAKRFSLHPSIDMMKRQPVHLRASSGFLRRVSSLHKIRMFSGPGYFPYRLWVSYCKLEIARFSSNGIVLVYYWLSPLFNNVIISSGNRVALISRNHFATVNPRNLSISTQSNDPPAGLRVLCYICIYYNGSFSNSWTYT